MPHALAFKRSYAFKVEPTFPFTQSAHIITAVGASSIQPASSFCYPIERQEEVTEARQGGDSESIMFHWGGAGVGALPWPLGYKLFFHTLSESRNWGGAGRQADTKSTKSCTQASQAGGTEEAASCTGLCVGDLQSEHKYIFLLDSVAEFCLFCYRDR